jgi:peroxiredoxin
VIMRNGKPGLAGHRAVHGCDRFTSRAILTDENIREILCWPIACGSHGEVNSMKLQAGVTLPDYEFPDHTGVQRRLSILQGGDPMVLILARGAFCPKERRYLLDLKIFSERCVVGYAQLITITNDSLMELNELRHGVGADWIFLSDPERRIQQDFGIDEYTDPKHRPMIPYTVVLEPGLKIYKAYDGYWFWGRPTTHELHMDLRAVTEKVRPDWRIDTPELRAAWERGDRRQFFPYGQDFHQVVARMSRAVDQFEEVAVSPQSER